MALVILHPMDTQSKSQLIDTIYNHLKHQIRQGLLPNGAKLSENTLAKDFSCSRTPVREALKRLEQDGFVVIIAHSGSYVKDITMVDYQQLTEVRAYLEALAMRLACENGADPSVLEQILDSMDELWKGGRTFDVQTFSSLHYQFHLELVKLSGNNLLVLTYSRLNLSEAALLFAQNITDRGITKTQAEHRRIVQAIRDRNEKEGERFMLSHLWRKRDRFRAQTQAI
ncbi:transcriptional regulator, GntR family [Sphaerochaeta globosa str. Buddy]|uniref:Transcriptional regulator, GntR family n=2 Tax=Sphaerochaeta TaxID=399320 RepID=F0RWD1_SPHGB|nr:transcriptional regulator, GntR family [Sphaerochaeta globosa str. Buddy]